MKELEDTNCEIRRIIELQSSIWDRLNHSSEDEQSPGNATHETFEPIKPLGGFLDGTNHAWISCGTRLIVFNVRSGESISSWNFRYRISSVSPFPTQPGQIPLLLVGLDNDAHRIKESVGLICVFECTTSRILRVIRVPSGVEQICVINGGAAWEEFSVQKAATILETNSGVACVALRNLDHIIIDLQRSSWESVSSYLIADELSPYELVFPRSKSSSSSSRHSHSREKHTAYSLINSRIEDFVGFNRETFESTPLSYDKLSTSIISSKKIGCLISGCLGRVMLWQSDGTIGWISTLFDENMSVSHLALIEPADDPRSFYYLWVACQDDSATAAPVLRMYAMLFEKKYCEKDSNLYFKLESDPSLKFEIELDEGDTITCLLPIERENKSEQTESGIRHGEESLLLIGTNNRMLLFDLNQWYKEQMPVTASECQNPNSILASYRTRSETPTSVKDLVINCAYVPSTLKEFTSSGPNTLEELFFPNTLSFEWLELTSNRLNFWLTRGLQTDLLRKIVVTGPVILIQPAETFHRCLNAGLVPFNIECSFNSNHNAQREMLLSLCLEQRWANFLIKCAKEWSDGSASYLFPAFLRWGVQRGSAIKIYADQLTIPLFDQSGSNIGESEAKTLRFCCQQLECLSTVVEKLTVDSADFLMQQRALKRVATYLQVLLWFHDVGLLPETQEVDESALRLALSLRIPYPYERLAALYKEKREQLKEKSNAEDDDLFIDALITRECPSLRYQWEREGVDVESAGHYPPPSLQSLLRSYLADCHQIESNEIENKHQITIYLLMDLAMLLQGSCPSIDQLIKYPAAFKLSPSLIKLTQAFWLLDHEDYQGFLDMMTGQLVSDSDFKDWHHKLVVKTLLHDNQHKLALMYLRVRKPPLSTIDEQGTIINLSVEHGLVQSAFNSRPSSHYAQLLTRFFRACKSYGKLSEILHLALGKEEEEAFVKFLEEDKCEETKLLYYLQRCRYTEASSVYSFGSRCNQMDQPISMNMFKAYNATLPDVTRRFTASLNRKNQEVDPDFRYPRPMSHARSYNRAREIHETVVRKAKETYVRGERSQIPFVSAPCLSLKSNPGTSDVNCILFLERKAPLKRTIHEVHGSGVDESSENKRRKLSEGRNVGERSEMDRSRMDRSMGDKSWSERTLGNRSELGIDALFSTPLIKRKTHVTKMGNTPVETPQSILKIRQMIKESASPSVNSLHSESGSEPMSEKRPRMIRFSVSQLRNDTMQSESIDESMNKETVDESKAKDESVSKEVIDEEASMSDAFFSPNVSLRSEESTILTDSSAYGKNLSGPRPRPGLRRSSVLSSSDSSRRTSMKTGSNSSIETPTSLSLVSKSLLDSSATSLDFNIGKSPRGMSSSVYSSSILSDSSLDDSWRRIGSGVKTDDWNVNSSSKKGESPGKTLRVTQVSVTSVTKTVVEEFVVEGDENEKVNEIEKAKNDEEINKTVGEVVDGEQDAKEESLIEKEVEKKFEAIKEADVDIAEDLAAEEIQLPEEATHAERSITEKMSESNGEVIMHLEDKLDESEKVSRIHEDTNRNILPGGSVISAQERQSLSGHEKEVDGESSDDLELLALKDDEDDEEEVFESLSNSVNSEVLHSLSEKSVQKEEGKSGPSKFVADDYSITDDESLEVFEQSIIEEVDKTLQNKEKEDESNITDDESEQTSTKESESQIVDSKGNSTSDLNEYSKSDSDPLSNINNIIIDEPHVEEKEEVAEVSISVSLRKTPVRETRLRRASSIAAETKNEDMVENSIANEISDPQRISSEFKDDNITKSNITRDKTPVRETRSQKTLSAKKDSLLSKETKTSEEGLRTPRRSLRASSVSKVVEQKTEELTPEIILKDVVKATMSRTPVSETKSRRLSVSKNVESQLEDVEVEKVRTRRGSSLVKEILATTVELGSRRGGRKISSGSECSVDTPTKRGRPRKTANVTQETSSVETEKESEERTVEIVRRSSRRGASVQKELSMIEETAPKKQKTILSMSIGEPIEMDTSIPVTRKTRSRRGSSMTKEIPPPRRTRASSLSKDTDEELIEPPPRLTRRRGASVPKEISMVASRSIRITSISEEVIPEEPEGDEHQSTTNLSLTSKVLADVTSSPVIKKRTRRPSVQSIPEEIEEILSVPAKSRSTTKNQKKEIIPRTRRAASVDLPVESKRLTRSSRLKSSIIEDAILEEPSEATEETQMSSKVVKKQPGRRKRAASETVAMDQKDEPEAKSTKEKPRRGRKYSQRSDDEPAEFAFSPPEKTNAPKDKKEIGQVPNFVFSPPHTRSKQTGQPRRRIPFVEPLTEEEKEEIALMKSSEGGKKSVETEKTKKPVLKRYMPRKTFKLPRNRPATSE